MANIFKRFTEVSNKPNRATYDLSFQNNVTMKFGTLYPVFCKEVLPGDSFRIKPTFGFNFMPLVSPVQTRMRAHLHFFYVRNRPHWKDFMDWDGMTKEGLTPPYLSINESNRKMIETGSIGDFLGLPTKVYDNVYKGVEYISSDDAVTPSDAFGYETDSTLILTQVQNGTLNSIQVGDTFVESFLSRDASSDSYPSVRSALIPTMELSEWINLDLEFNRNTQYASPAAQCKVVVFDENGVCRYVSEQIDIENNIAVGTIKNVGSLQVTDEWYNDSLIGRRGLSFVGVIFADDAGAVNLGMSIKVGKLVMTAIDVSELPLEQIPWANGEVRINAFPFRAYESIYNSFYRDDRNNPRMVNGQPEYNKFITTDEGGADSTYYKLYNRNWEPDFLTTAVQSPQQGVAPLVGITSVNSVGDITLTDSNGTEYTAKTTLAEDGDTIVGINITSGNGTSSVNRALVDMASTGISISDLRNVNALQRWLEINMRRGLRYRDQVKSHYGVDLEYKELNMPEFIGGVSEDVIVNRISQTTETEANPLGSLAGQAGVIGTSKHDISHYCDEKGYIIGILSIAPVPNYSQILPKHLIKSSQLDYFTPEFAHIGMQPILNSEVSPLQASLEGKLNDVFGYQRPWYDYLASTDEVHGQFRDTLRRYLINRVFDGTPELGSEFLTIDSEQINDVFAVTDDTDKIYGQVYFDVTAKRPIAANVTPRIEP